MVNRRTLLGGGLVVLYGACRGRLESIDVLAPQADRDLDTGQELDSSQDNQTARRAQPALPRSPGQSSIEASESSKLMGVKVAIDVGHSEAGRDRGAQSNGLDEHVLNLEESQQLAAQLRLHGAQVTVFHYPDSIPLASRGQNATGHDILVSVHHNAFSRTSVQGTEVLISHSKQSASDKTLAQAIQKNMVKRIWGSNPGIKDRGTKAQNLAVLNAKPPSVRAAVLTEAFFISAVGMNAARAEDYVSKAAAGIAEGIVSYWTSASRTLQSTELQNDYWELDEDVLNLYSGH